MFMTSLDSHVQKRTENFPRPFIYNYKPPLPISLTTSEHCQQHFVFIFPKTKTFVGCWEYLILEATGTRWDWVKTSHKDVPFLQLQLLRDIRAIRKVLATGETWCWIPRATQCFLRWFYIFLLPCPCLPSHAVVLLHLICTLLCLHSVSCSAWAPHSAWQIPAVASRHFRDSTK